MERIRARYLTTGILSLLSSACQGEGTTSPIEQHGSKPAHAETAVNPTGFLSLPFPPDPDMRIQTGFLRQDGSPHKGIDYIKGEIDRSTTWMTFPVLAPADGLACANPPDRQGNAVFIQHFFAGKTFFTYVGHLEKYDPSIPECLDKNNQLIPEQDKKPVKRGDKLGDAGSTGLITNNLPHAHLGVTADTTVDPYGLNATRDSYPDPNWSNGKFCGERSLFLDCSSTAVATRQVLGQSIDSNTHFNPIELSDNGWIYLFEKSKTIHSYKPPYRFRHPLAWVKYTGRDPEPALEHGSRAGDDQISFWSIELTENFRNAATIKIEPLNKERANSEGYKNGIAVRLNRDIAQLAQRSKFPPSTIPTVRFETARIGNNSGFFASVRVPDGSEILGAGLSESIVDADINIFTFVSGSYGMEFSLYTHPKYTPSLLDDFKKMISTFEIIG